MGDNFFFKFFGLLTLPFRFPLAVVSSTVLVPMLASINTIAIVAGTVAIKSFNKADQRNIDPDFLGLIDFSKSAFRALVKFGTYPLPDIMSAEKSGDIVDKFNGNLLKSVGVSYGKKIDIPTSELQENKQNGISANEEKNRKEVSNMKEIPSTSITPISATNSLQPEVENIKSR